MSLLNMLSQQLNDPKVLEQLSKNTGANPDQVKKLAQDGLPELMKALQQNASTPEGAKSLDRALEEHKDDKVDNILGFLQNVDTADGAKMLQHIFSGKNDAVQTQLAQKAGLNKNQASALLTQLAPLVIGALGNQKKQQGGSNVMTLVGGMLGGFFKK